MTTMVYLIVMSLLAGILTGIVGMASLTLYPVLLSVGISPISANATITVAQIAGGIGTVTSSRHELRGHWRQAGLIAAINTAGGILGAVILIHSSNASFQAVVPLFILLAGVMILWPTRQPVQAANATTQRPWLGWLGIWLVGIYTGYFGAGAGLLMIAVLSKIVHERYATFNAMRNFSSLCNNIAATLIFIATLPIAWRVIVPLIIGLFVGGYLGPMIVRIIPANIIKKAVGVFAIVLAAYLAYQNWGTR